MMNLEHIEYFVPPHRRIIEKDYALYGISAAQAKVYSRIYGLVNVPVAQQISVTELLLAPLQKLLQITEVEKSNIKLIIHSHTAKVITPFGYSVVRDICERLSLTQALYFGMTLHNCASTLSALDVASVYLKKFSSEDNAKAIILTGEKAFTPTVQIIPNTSITGDAATAVMVSHASESDQLLHMEFATFGEFAEGIWLSPEMAKKFEAEYVPCLARTILEALNKTNLSLTDIKMIFPHNVNLISWMNLAKALSIEKKQIYLKNIQQYAHCFGSDVFINLKDAKTENILQSGDYYMLATVGLGATFAVAILQAK